MVREAFSQTGASPNGWRRHAEPGTFMLLFRRACREGFRHRVEMGKLQKLNLPLATATKKQFDCMVVEGLGELDKSGVAELTFKAATKINPVESRVPSWQLSAPRVM